MDKQFDAERMYYASVSIAKAMLNAGVITPDVFELIKDNLLKKYRPVSTILIVGKSLT